MRVGAGLAALLLGAAPAAAAECRLALVLALDISSSVNEREYAIQIGGLARAFRTPEVIEAILSPEGTGIAVAAYEWSGQYQQDMIVGWTMLDSEAAALDFADRLDAHRRSYAEFPTAVGKGLQFGAALFASAPPCARRTIDVSGDGANNDGVGPGYFRDKGVFEGITINGLAILGAEPDPGEYYRRHVIQGPGAFVAIARDFEDYPDVIIGKLLKEIDAELVLGALP